MYVCVFFLNFAKNNLQSDYLFCVKYLRGDMHMSCYGVTGTNFKASMGCCDVPGLWFNSDIHSQFITKTSYNALCIQLWRYTCKPVNGQHGGQRDLCVTTFDSASCRIGAGLTQCTF